MPTQSEPDRAEMGRVEEVGGAGIGVPALEEPEPDG